ncbi:MAG: GtrA family protein [Alphaproteobacteria bacterium]
MLSKVKNYLNLIFLIKNPQELFITVKNNQKLRFLFIGGYNTAFNYFIGLGLYKFLKMDLLKISIFYFFSIIHNYLTHKFLCFKIKKFCKFEVLRAIAVYGIMYLFSTFLILFLIKIGFSQLIAYHINLLVSLVLFYILHCWFTFRMKI